jgi:NAD(P)-dependent dehydrogenase (short-subunit alcohol dehydrogenase family)
MSLVYRMLDGVLEATVVGSYSKIGYALRKPFWNDHDTAVDLSGRVAVITGANSGIGRATATALAHRGATVVLACRREDRGLAARDVIRRETGNADVELELVDLSSLDSVHAASSRLAERFDAIHILVNNAGVMLHERKLSPDGVEMNFATNVLGPFALTNLLVPRLAAADHARIVHVTSGGMYTQKLDVDDLQSTRLDPFDGVVAYAQNKRAQVLLNETWAQKLGAHGVTSHAMHPGWAATPNVATSLPRFNKVMGPILRDWNQGADTIVWLCCAPQLDELTGLLFFDRRPRPATAFSSKEPDPGDHEKLWKACVDLSGVDLAIDGGAPGAGDAAGRTSAEAG